MAILDILGELIHDIELLVFDKDGTIMELYNYWGQMIHARAEYICHELGLDLQHRQNLSYVMGVDEEKGCLRPEGPVGIKTREIVMLAANDYLSSIGLKNCYQLCYEAFDYVDKHSTGNLPLLIKPINGVHELFRSLKDSSCKIAIATTDKTERAKLAMQYLELDLCIDMIVGADQVEKVKPDPEMVALILKELKIASVNTVVVGDAITDIMMGINASVKATIGVSSGLTPTEQLKACTHLVIDDISCIRVVR